MISPTESQALWGMLFVVVRDALCCLWEKG